MKRVVILGSSRLALTLIKAIEAEPRSGYTVIGAVSETTAAGNPPFRCPLLGSFEDLGRIIEGARPDRIIVTLDEGQRLPARPLFEARERGIIVEDGVEVYERLTGKLAIESFTPGRLIFGSDFDPSRAQILLHRLLSLVLTSLGLILAAPLMLILAVAVKLDSRGPVFFIQERVGMGGRIFRMIKFRTMHRADGKTSEWAKDNGHRITRVGKRLRKFRLDELPQFVNILKGDMDLIGPRPHPVTNHGLFVMALRNTPECGEAIPYYALRCLIRPGITGWAQVRYRYANDLDEEIEKMKYDLYYIKHMSPWLDLKILIETVKTAFRGGEPGESDVYRTEASMEARAQ
jgi:exopolysaccharide biosynthesis polyprenyl glycosylphosphotransferase